MRTSKSIRSLLQRGSQPPSITSGKVPNAVRKWESFKVEKKKKEEKKEREDVSSIPIKGCWHGETGNGLTRNRVFYAID